MYRFLSMSWCAFFVVMLISCVGRDAERGNASLRLGDYAMAIRMYESVLEKNPEHFEARLGMGKAFIQRATDNAGDTASWKTALTHLEAARTLRPREPIEPLLGEAWLVHGRRLLALGDTIEALSALSRAIEHNPRSPDPLNYAGIVYFRIGDPDKARYLFSKAVEADTTQPAALFNLGMVEYRQGRIAAAHGRWLAALTRAPHDEDILYWFALAEKMIREAQ